MEQVLIISYWNPTEHKPHTGIFIYNQVVALCKNSSGIIFIEINLLPSRGKVLEREVSVEALHGNTVITFNIFSFFWKILYSSPFLVFRWVSKFLTLNFADFKPTIIHSNVIFPCAIAGKRFADLYKAKHVITEHWTKVNKILSHPLFGKSALDTYRKSDAIICVSNYLGSLIREKTGNRHVYRIPNIIDDKVFKYRPKIERPENSYRFLCVASWRDPKRLDLILDSLVAFAVSEHLQLVIHVIGEGIQKENYAKMTYPSNLQVIFHGYASKNDIADLFTETDFFMHASGQETFSIVTAEALATGTPVMVSNIEALPELVTSENGLLIENDLNAWVEGLKRITSMQYNHKEIAAREVDKYTPEKIAGMIRDVYTKILGK